MRGDRDLSIHPRHRRVCHHNGQFREVGGNVVEQHRVGVPQFDPVTTGQRRPETGLSGVEQCGHSRRGDGLIDRIEPAVVGLEALQARMELESADAVVPDQFADPSECIGRQRVDGAERDQHVVVARSALDQFLDRIGPVAGGCPGVDGEHHRGGVVATVMLGEVVDPREMIRTEIEVASRRLGQFRVVGALAGRVDLDVGVDVDGLYGVDVDRALVARH